MAVLSGPFLPKKTMKYQSTKVVVLDVAPELLLIGNC